MNSDPISDFLTRIRNASMVNKPSVIVPHSKFKLELSKLLKNEGYNTLNISDGFSGNGQDHGWKNSGLPTL